MSDPTTTTSIRRSGIRVRTLGAIAAHSLDDEVVRKRDLSIGDRVIVRTRNSIYTLISLGGDSFLVSGGWYESHGRSPAAVDVHGCTYGGSAIRSDLVAAPGLFLELSDFVLTTRIRAVGVIPWG
jgi:hypothetical protein